MFRVSIAICGLGRAGSIHTGNCVRNPRVHIKYFVEIDTARAEEVKKNFNLTDTIVVHANDFHKVQGIISFRLFLYLITLVDLILKLVWIFERVEHFAIYGDKIWIWLISNTVLNERGPCRCFKGVNN